MAKHAYPIDQLPKNMRRNMVAHGISITPVTDDDYALAKDFMKKNFYSTALQCTSLRLSELCSEDGGYLDQELGTAKRK